MKKLRLEEERRQNRISQGLIKKKAKIFGCPKLSAFVKIGITVFLGFLLLEIWMVNRLTTYGDKIQQLKNSQASLELENQVLENSIAVSQSLNKVAKEAESLGFASLKNIEYYSTSDLASAQ